MKFKSINIRKAAKSKAKLHVGKGMTVKKSYANNFARKASNRIAKWSKKAV